MDAFGYRFTESLDHEITLVDSPTKSEWEYVAQKALDAARRGDGSSTIQLAFKWISDNFETVSKLP